MKPMPTRERMIAEIKQRHPRLEDQIHAWAILDISGQIPEPEWAEAHAGVCALCGGEGARLYASGWACSGDHVNEPRVYRLPQQ